MNIDLRAEKRGGSWTRRFGDHEGAGFSVYANDTSANVTLIEHNMTFDVDRQDVPAAWEEQIDAVKLRAELIDTIVRRMSAGVLEALFRVIHSLRDEAYKDGQMVIRAEIRKVIGL